MPRSTAKLELIVNRPAPPSERFVKLTRDPDLPRPWRFEPTVKGENDVVI